MSEEQEQEQKQIRRARKPAESPEQKPDRVLYLANTNIQHNGEYVYAGKLLPESLIEDEPSLKRLIELGACKQL